MIFSSLRKRATCTLIAAVTLVSATAYLSGSDNVEEVSARSYSYSISNGQQLNNEDYIQNGSYKAKMQPDGNFVVYNFGYGYNGMSSTYWQKPVWATATYAPNVYSSCRACMQNDGNFVVYANQKSNGQQVVLYNSATNNSMTANQNISYSLYLSNTGSLYVRRHTPSGTTILRDITSASGGALTWPVPGRYSLTSSYTETAGRTKQHRALDIGTGNSGGNPAVVASVAGTVKYINTDSYGGGYGNYIVIEGRYHYRGVSALCVIKYNHLKSVNVSVGQFVTNGQTIGYMGNTGGDYGVHLDFQFYPQPYYGVSGNNVLGSNGSWATPTDPLMYMKWPKGIYNNCGGGYSCAACIAYFNQIKARFVRF